MYLNNKGETLYEVGDRVVITDSPFNNLQDVPTGVNHHTLLWVCDMDKYCGQTATITRIVSLAAGKYRIDIDNGLFTWCASFFQQTLSPFEISDEEDELSDFNINNFLSAFKVRSEVSRAVDI